MKLFIATAALVISGAAFAQASQPTDASRAGAITGNTGPVTNGAASATDVTTTTDTPSMATAAATASMSVKGSKWMMGDRQATKAEIAQWKKENPSMTKPM